MTDRETILTAVKAFDRNTMAPSIEAKHDKGLTDCAKGASRQLSKSACREIISFLRSAAKAGEWPILRASESGVMLQCADALDEILSWSHDTA